MAKQRVDIVVAAKDQASRTLSGIAKTAIGMGAAFLSWRAIKSVVAGSVEAYNQQVQAETKLQQALKATGGAAGFSFGQLKEYAAQLQNVTEYGDEATIEMMSLLATFKNVQGPVFTESTGLILDMSKAMNQDLKSTVIQVGKALNDPIKGITALSRVGVSFTEQQKQQIEQFVKTNDLAAAQKIILAELASEFGGQATAAANTFGGAIKQLGNAWGDAKEKMGEYIASLPGFINVVKIAKGVIENFGLSMKILWTSSGLVLIEFWENLKYIFTGKIPSVLVWFRDNWKIIFTDMWNGTKTIFSNMFENIKNFFIATWGWLKGDSFDFQWTGLLEGFEATLKELPNIVDRNKSYLEQALELELTGLIEDFNKNLKMNLTVPTANAPTPGGGGAPPDLAAAAKGGKGVAAVESRFLFGTSEDPSKNSKSKLLMRIDSKRENLKGNLEKIGERNVGLQQKILKQLEDLNKKYDQVQQRETGRSQIKMSRMM